MDPLPWRDAWHEALYAVGRGFYVSAGGPAAHFTTATHGPPGAVLAEALLRLVGHRPRVIVDVGAGRGELASHLVEALQRTGTGADARGTSHPDPHLRTNEVAERDASATSAVQWAEDASAGSSTRPVRVIAVDVVDRPDGLDERVEWLRSPGGASLPAALGGLDCPLDDALVIAHEWLDVVPCIIAEVDSDGTLREVLVDTTGAETLGAPVTGADLVWAREHWPTAEPGDRVEVGRSRDEAWADLVARVRSGILVAVDYGHTRGSRPSAGTLTAYVSGRQTHPVPDGTCDITAHVAMDTLDADEVTTQREALRGLGVRGATPPIELARADPVAYLGALAQAGAEALLIDPSGFGSFRWAVKRVGGAAVP